VIGLGVQRYILRYRRVKALPKVVPKVDSLLCEWKDSLANVSSILLSASVALSFSYIAALLPKALPSYGVGLFRPISIDATRPVADR
jgi:hypothetical protein